MKIAIANFTASHESRTDFRAFWAEHDLPPRPPRLSLFDQRHDWGFHITALGVRMLDLGMVDSAELWIDGDQRRTAYDSAGVLRVTFANVDDVSAYVARHGAPDLFINYGRKGQPLLDLLDGRSFRVHVPCLREGDGTRNRGAECYLVDDPRYLDRRARLYVPVVNTHVVRPAARPALRDFIYLASAYKGKRHDLLLDAVRGTGITGHLHPVNGVDLDLRNTQVTTSGWDEHDVVDLLQTSRIAVYAGDWTSNPAAMWECVAAGLPIVVNAAIKGGQHVVVPGVTGELAAPRKFGAAIAQLLRGRETYRPREYFDEHWDTLGLLDGYLSFFQSMGWRPRD